MTTPIKYMQWGDKETLQLESTFLPGKQVPHKLNVQEHQLKMKWKSTTNS